MKKYILSAILLFLIILKSIAQDATRIDLGRLTLNKDFAILKTIKAQDLEKIPGANLSFAINNYFFGNLYGEGTHPIVIVDGSARQDINGFSIFDIEEISLVQNVSALALYGNTGNVPIVLVTTKKAAGTAWQVRGEAQVAIQQYKEKESNSIVGIYNPISSNYNLVNNGYESEDITLYHQYYAGASKKTLNGGFNISANYHRDKTPALKYDNNEVYITPINRLRLNAAWDGQLDKNFGVKLYAGYSPDEVVFNEINNAISATRVNTNSKKSKLFQTGAELNYKSSTGIHNSLQVGYRSLNANQNSSAHISSISSRATQNIANDFSILYLRNHLSYTKQAGNFKVRPAVDFEYSKIKTTMEVEERSVSGSFESISEVQATVDNKSYYLTPQLEINYAGVLSLHSGVLLDVSEYPDASGISRVLPFAGLDVNFIKPGKAARFIVNTSYGNIRKMPNPYEFYNFASLFNSGAGYIVPPNNSLETELFDNYQAGALLGYKKWSLTFNWNQYKQSTLYLNSTLNPAGYSQVLSYRTDKGNFYRFALSSGQLQLNELLWHSELNFNLLKSNTVFPIAGNEIIIDNDAKTGGWNNRLNYKNFSGGIDFLYIIDASVPIWQNAALTTKKENQIKLQNFFAGYNFALKGGKKAEAYLFARNLLDIAGNYQNQQKMYYGLGLGFIY